MSSTATLFRFSTEDDHGERVQVSKDIALTMRPRSGACVDCKSVKVRCEFGPGEQKCRRCQTKNLPCQARERKKRKPAETHEQLQERAHEKDIQIQRLLQQYDQLKAEQKLRTWVEKTLSSINKKELSLIKDRTVAIKWDSKGKSPESAAVAVFGGQQPSNLSPPPIIKYCALYPEEIQELFSLYFDRINPFFSILDPEEHTAENLIWTCPFLFTIMCAVASRYYVNRPDIYPLAMELARDMAGQTLVSGYQSIDVCQAYLIMAVYPTPRKRWAEDKSWLLMGVAIRMAMELGLNQPPPQSCTERESLNRVRTWLNCYCVDCSHAIQFGKMPMVRLDDYVASSSGNWYKSSTMNNPFDVHLCAYVQLLAIVAEWRTRTTEYNKGQLSEDFDVVAFCLDTQHRLFVELSNWMVAYREEFILRPLPICAYRQHTSQMITAYLRLVVLATAFQYSFNSLKRGLSRQDEVVRRAFDAARTVISIMLEYLYPSGHLRYGMEAHFLYVSYAAAFLANLLRPKFLPLLDEKQQKEIISLVTRLIDVLSSREVALDGRHTPALYSRFLSSLMERHNVKAIQFADSSSPSTSTDNPYLTRHDSERSITPPFLSSWPDTSNINTITPPSSHMGDGLIYQQNGEAAMDFSLNHFVRTVSQEYPSAEVSSSDMGGSHMQVPYVRNFNVGQVPSWSFPGSGGQLWQ